MLFFCYVLINSSKLAIITIHKTSKDEMYHFIDETHILTKKKLCIFVASF